MHILEVAQALFLASEAVSGEEPEDWAGLPLEESSYWEELAACFLDGVIVSPRPAPLEAI